MLLSYLPEKQLSWVLLNQTQDCKGEPSEHAVLSSSTPVALKVVYQQWQHHLETC